MPFEEMNNRHISVIGLFQILALGCAIWFATVAARFLERDLFEGKPLPALFRFAPVFRDYGMWGAVIVLAWCGLALRAASSNSDRYALVSLAAGIGLVLMFLLLAFLFFVSLFMPVGPLMEPLS